MNSQGRYRPVPPDAAGRLLSEQTGLWFTVSPNGDRVILIDAATREAILPRREERVAREAEARRADREAERADREAEARRAAEAEIARLREQLDQLNRR